ncbi:hypothetical protein [Pseudomonas indica]|uniref:Secreted protein n=1 Tax=Pseudomonas indica TaxID=137658 RepID=A0A1G9DTK7_9PSED|nr:hypothetical protein [Pseudomonas indica]MBU3058342.1 hypothetical protein [Pseudomonas indica]PAU61728.1 hypothetical protein BZL42_07640 [Pseudomonas indica]SDK67150.1 hypothetical protein SAMN05216186_10999 [Pseudomonas indica]
MKRTILLITATLLTAPAFAEDLCAVNLQKLDDTMATMTASDPIKENVEEHRKAAEEARAAGDLETCASHAEKALQAITRQGEGNETNGGGTTQ